MRDGRGQGIDGPQLGAGVDQALGPVGGGAEGGFDLGRVGDGDGGAVPDHQGGEGVAGGDAGQVAVDQGVGGPVRLTPGEIAALIASVASVGPYVSATARSALDRLVQALRPT